MPNIEPYGFLMKKKTCIISGWGNTSVLNVHTNGELVFSKNIAIYKW